MNFKRYSGEVNIKPFKKAASVAFAVGDLVYVDSNGFLQKAVAATAAKQIVGISMETIASTDTDYATARDVAVDVLDKGDNGDWATGVVGNGTLAQTSVGEGHDLTSTGAVDQAANSVNAVKCQRFLSATLGLFSLLGASVDAQ